MSDTSTVSKVEIAKEHSRQLRGTIAEELRAGAVCLSEDNTQLIKNHGSYQQDDRDDRHGNKKYIFMVRTRVPGGKVTAAQFLAEFDLCEKYGNGTLRVTDRQGFQLHGVLIGHLKDTIKGINDTKLTTLAACGDVNRNVMCCPAPIRNNPVRDEMQAMADQLAAHFKPHTTAYCEIWLKEDQPDAESQMVAEFKPVEEPIYGPQYLPRKFKMGIALPEDNCVDLYAQDLGLLAIVENHKIVGYNVLVGGGMGCTPANKKTFPAIAYRFAYIRPDQVLGVAEAIVKVQRDNGNRADRKLARMKYLIANWGLEKFKAEVEKYYGEPLPAPHPTDVHNVDDHIGWHEQGDGKPFLGINVENGRIQDHEGVRMKTALRVLLKKYGMDTRLTALQGVILCDINPSDRGEIETLLKEHGVKLANELTLARRYSIACPAYPTCGLAVTESERVMPTVMDQIETELAKHGLINDRLAIHMTGCPNGCARPYNCDIGLVGKAKHKYTVFLGGNPQGARMSFLWQDMVPQDEIATRLSPLFGRYKAERSSQESFGDFCHRVGKEHL